MTFSRILIRATNWVGDAVMSMPALQALREAYPGAYMAVLARPWVADLYRGEPFCDEVIAYPADWTRRLVLAATLRKQDFDCAVVLPNSFESALTVRLAGARKRIGYNRDGRGFLLTRAIAPPRAGEVPRHQRFYYLELLRRAGLLSEYGEATVALHHTAVASGGKRIGIAPGAAFGGAKRWLPERFAEAALQLPEHGNAEIVIVGSAAEARICQTVAEHLPGRRVQNLAGKTTLRELVNEIARCTLFLTNDSGPMHIAYALGVPTVAVFGATDDRATGPWGPHSRVVRHPVECSPCLLRECPIDHRCMTGLTARAVAAEAENLIGTLVAFPAEQN